MSYSILWFLLLICSCVTEDSEIFSKGNKNLDTLLCEVEMAKYSREGSSYLIKCLNDW